MQLTILVIGVGEQRLVMACLDSIEAHARAERNIHCLAFRPKLGPGRMVGAYPNDPERLGNRAGPWS